MNLNRICVIVLILIGLLIIWVDCSNDSPKSKNMSKEKAAMLNQEVNPERIIIKLSPNANFQDDFDQSISDGDFRFVGVFGYTVDVPGVPNYNEKYRKTNGVKVIEGTTDSYQGIDSEEAQNATFFKEYAVNYNALLLEYLSNADK